MILLPGLMFFIEFGSDRDFIYWYT